MLAESSSPAEDPDASRNGIAAQIRKGMTEFATAPSAFRTLTREDLLREDIFDRLRSVPPRTEDGEADR